MRTPTCVLLLGVILTGCATAGGDASASSAPSLRALASPRSSVAAAATQPVSPSPSPTSLNATPTPAAFGAEVFPDPDDCTNAEVGYRVAYPSSWYSNAASDGIEPCWLFAPTNFQVVYGTEIPAEVAIIIRRFDEWDFGAFSGREIITDDPAIVDGLPARVQEVEITERTIGFAPGHRLMLYGVQLPDGAYLVAETYLGPDFQAAGSVLDDMMRTIQIELP